MPAGNERQVIYNFWKLDLQYDVAGWIQLAFKQPENRELIMARKVITETKNDQPKIVQTSPVMLPSHLLRANAAAVRPAVDNLTDCERQLSE